MNVGFWYTDDSFKGMCPVVSGSLDGAGLQTAIACGSRGMLLRPYFKGVHDPAQIAVRIVQMDAVVQPAKKGYVDPYYQIGNEPNLSFEGWQGGVDSYVRFYDAVRAAVPSNIQLTWAPMSPGVPGYLDWYAAYRRAQRPPSAVCAHVYGQTLDQLKRNLDDIRRTVGNTSIIIGECNFGPGPGVVVDKDAWATDVWSPFLDHVAQIPNVLFTLYFAWTWNADTSLATSVDAKLTKISQVTTMKALQDLTMDVTPTLPSTARLTQAHGPPRLTTKGVFVHSTRSGITGNSLLSEYNATVGYFMAPDGDSAHFVVGPVESTRMVHDADQSYHAIENNATHLGIELCQPTASTPYTDWQYHAAAEIVRLWCDKYRIPKTRVYSQALQGVIGHEDSEQGKRYGKTDPGSQFNWNYFIRLVNGGTMAFDPEPDRAAIYAVLEQLQTAHVSNLALNGYPILADGLNAAMQSAKRAISLSKGEK